LDGDRSRALDVVAFCLEVEPFFDLEHFLGFEAPLDVERFVDEELRLFFEALPFRSADRRRESERFRLDEERCRGADFLRDPRFLELERRLFEGERFGGEEFF